MTTPSHQERTIMIYYSSIHTDKGFRTALIVKCTRCRGWVELSSACYIPKEAKVNPETKLVEAPSFVLPTETTIYCAVCVCAEVKDARTIVVGG